MFKVLVVAEEWWSDHLHTNVIGRLFKQFVQQDVGDGVPCLTAVAKEIALRVHDGGIPSLDPHAYEHVADKSQLL